MEFREPVLRGVEARATTGLRRRRLLWGVMLLSGSVVCVALAERWRGQWQFARLKKQAETQGEVLAVERLWPRPTAGGLAFSNEVHRALDGISRDLEPYSGRICGVIGTARGVRQRGSQQPAPVLEGAKESAGSWDELQRLVDAAEPGIGLMRKALRHPPADMGYDIARSRDEVGIPNFVNQRRGAQVLQAAAFCELHRGNLQTATENLVALAAFSRAYQDDPTLVNYMIRIAIVGLGVEPAWDALQSDGWTEVQLAELARAFDCDQLLARMPRTVEAARADRLQQYDWFASHSYLDWVGRYQPIYEAFGHKVPKSGPVLVTRAWREWIFHPLWKFAWADQERIEVLKGTQRELDLLRKSVQTGSWVELSRDSASLRAEYRAPVARWRFYLMLPLLDQIGESPEGDGCPFPDFSRAWLVSMKNLTAARLVQTGVALKRYHLRHGKLPATLQDLVPACLERVPRDLMDGQPLRYTALTPHRFRLYSVGEDGRDDGGRWSTGQHDFKNGLLAGPDFVWSAAAPVARHQSQVTTAQ